MWPTPYSCLVSELLCERHTPLSTVRLACVLVQLCTVWFVLAVGTPRAWGGAQPIPGQGRELAAPQA